jgi:hypothetical protein
MPVPTPAKPFGRRNLPAENAAATLIQQTPAALGYQPSNAVDTATSEALLKFTAELAERRRNSEYNFNLEKNLIVPYSGRAALLAGLIAAFIHASLDLGGSIAFGQQSSIVTMTGQTVAVPLLLLAGLWSGARASLIGLICVRLILARLQITHVGAYALCGGLVGLLYSLILHLNGWDHLEVLGLDSATGLAAGFFYRIFAGTRPA